MGEEVGTIISSEETPTPEEFSFVLNTPVKKGQFVEFDTEEGRAMARVSNVIKTNRYFMEAESVSEHERSGKPLQDVLPTEDWEHLIGEGRTLGVYNEEGRVERPSFPPSPGTNVEKAEKERLRDFLGLTSSGLNVGEVRFHDIEASLDLTNLLQKHLAILAQTGAGKSYLASVLLEELLDREEEKGQLAVVAIDPHGEYAGFAGDENYMDKVRVYSEDEIQIGASSLSAGKMEHYFSDFRPAQRRLMEKVVDDLRDEKGIYGIEDLISGLERRDVGNQKTKEILMKRLRRMKGMGLFGQHDSPSLNRIEEGKLNVLDLSGVIDNKKKHIIAAHFTQQLFRARREGEIPPFFLLVEEAHNFIPERVSSSDAPAKSVIRKIAREGRKFHASLGLVSQRPAYLDQTTLSQCNSNIILRVTNPNDLDRIKKGAEGITEDVARSIPGLGVGEAVVLGEAVNHPAFISVRERRSEDFETGKDLAEAARDYNEEEAQEDEDVEAFM